MIAFGEIYDRLHSRFGASRRARFSFSVELVLCTFVRHRCNTRCEDSPGSRANERLSLAPLRIFIKSQSKEKFLPPSFSFSFFSFAKIEIKI